MKLSIGISRKCDKLGRIVLPVEFREVMDLHVRDAVEIFTEGNTIILKKYGPHCIFCGEARGTLTYRGNQICSEYIQKLMEQAEAPVAYPDDLIAKREDIAADSPSSCD